MKYITKLNFELSSMRIGIKMTDMKDVASVDVTNQNLIHMQTKNFRKLEKHYLCGHQGKHV